LGFETENRHRFSARKWKLRIEIYYTLITRFSVTRAFEIYFGLFDDRFDTES